MPEKRSLTLIECYSLSHLNTELTAIQEALSVPETEESWDSIADALSRFSALCNGNAETYPAELVLTIRASSRSITSALSSERTRLSGTATEFIATAVTALGSEFEPLIPHYLPCLFTLCTRTNKVFLNRAKACIAALVEYTHALSIIHYSYQSINDKSTSLRLAAAETMLACLNSFNPPDLEKDSRAKEIEATIRATAVDANADVRKVARKIFDAYKILLPGRVQSFTDPLTPRTRKYLDIKTTTVPKPQSMSRPASSQSVHSNHSDTHANPIAQRSMKPIRTVPTSQVSGLTRPPETHVPQEGARRVAREEPRRLKINMPPPEYIPARSADTGPQRPMSATELQLPASHRSGPQRVLRLEAAQGGPATINVVRTGPMRPALFAAMSSGVGDAGERKERVVGGARRVLRVPEVPSSRPRVISTSRSTAIPLQTASVRVGANKLASSVGPAVPATRLSRKASSTTLTQPTAGSRARAQDKVVDKEKSKPKAALKPPEALRPGPGSSVAVRDRASRVVLKSKPDSAKPSAKKSHVPSGKPHPLPEVPQTAETVFPAEAPLPELQTINPACKDSCPPLISFETPHKQDSPHVFALERATDFTDTAPRSEAPATIATEIPLPASPVESTPTPPAMIPSINLPEPVTPIREERPHSRQVEQTPISALVASIQHGFLSMHDHSKLSTLREEDGSVMVVDEAECAGQVFANDEFQPVKIEPLFSKSGMLHA